MSSLWTPGGERPVGRDQGGGQPSHEPQDEPTTPGDPNREELEAELAEMHRQIAEAPASAVIANHAVGLFQLAGVHLGQQPPHLDDARLAIDALAAIVEGLAGRLGPDEPTLKDALAQIQLAFVQIQASGASPPGAGPTGPGGPGEPGPAG